MKKRKRASVRHHVGCAAVGGYPIVSTSFGPLRCSSHAGHTAVTDSGPYPLCSVHAGEAGQYRFVTLHAHHWSQTGVQSVHRMSSSERAEHLAREVMES